MLEISVVIPTYNRCQSLARTLKSLSSQEDASDFSFEIIVVDNNSTDQTKAAVQEFASIFNGKLKYIFEERQGRTHALNTGINRAGGSLIAITDDDCYVDRKWLRLILREFAKYDCDMLGGRIEAVLGKAKIPDWLDFNTMGPVLAYFDRGDKHLLNDSAGFRPLGANMIFKRSSLMRYGGFNNNTRSQDAAIGIDWHDRGAKIVYSPDVIVYHYNDPRRLTKKYFRQWHFLTGKNMAGICGYKSMRRHHVLGVPLWCLKEFLASVFAYIYKLITLRPPKEQFWGELLVLYNLGVIWGCLGFETHIENLR